MGCCGSTEGVERVDNPRHYKGGRRGRSKRDQETLRRIEEEKMEAELQRLMKERQVRLATQARPLLESRNSMFMMVAEDGEPVEDEVKSRKHKEDRQLKATREATAEHKWVIFANLDKLGDDQVDELVRFKAVVLEYVPIINANSYTASRAALDAADAAEGAGAAAAESESESESNAASVDKAPTPPTGSSGDAKGKGKGLTPLSINVDLPPATPIEASVGSAPARETNISGLLQLDRLKVVTQNKDQGALADAAVGLSEDVLSGAVNYELPDGPITYLGACQVFEVIKHGGKVSLNSVHRILRAGYRSIKPLPNVIHCKLETVESKCTIVGDLHGQLADLINIMEESGLPSATHKYIFNGDFVDRGPMGVEITLLLLVFRAVLPDSVYMNRGNHEDFAVCCVYGFQAECCAKYDEITFGMYIEIFQFLPLVTVINNGIIVMHGGLFHSQEVTLEHLNKVSRTDFTLQDIPEGGETLVAFDPIKEPDQFYKQLQRDLLWSDPSGNAGVNESSRGAGVAFGPDVAMNFLARNNLQMIVRSHECVDHGFEYPYADAGVGQNCLCTLFSASNYGGQTRNNGAYMEVQILRDEQKEPAAIAEAAAIVHTAKDVIEQNIDVVLPGNCHLSYSVHAYHITPEMEEIMKRTHKATSLSIHEIVARKKNPLMAAFRRKAQGVSSSNLGPLITGAATVAAASPVGKPGSLPVSDSVRAVSGISNYITIEDWVEVMSAVVDPKLHWSSMLGILVPESCRDIAGGRVEYIEFLNHFGSAPPQSKRNSHGVASPRHGAGGSVTSPRSRNRTNSAVRSPSKSQTSFFSTNSEVNSVPESLPANDRVNIIESLYRQHKQMEIVFDYFDLGNTGVISREEFMHSCAEINKSIPANLHIKNSEKIFDTMDIDQTLAISANEFFEIFRIAELRAEQRAAAAAKAAQQAAAATKSHGLASRLSVSKDSKDPADPSSAAAPPADDTMKVLLALSDCGFVNDQEYEGSDGSESIDDGGDGGDGEESDDDSVVPDYRPDVRGSLLIRSKSMEINGRLINIDKN